MGFLRKALLVLAGALLASGAMAGEKPVYEVARLADGLYELRADGGGYTVKVIASVGKDGILLVDAGQRQSAGALLETLRTLGEGSPRILINTHSHIEHTGGNFVAGKGALIIGQENVRTRLRNGSFLWEEFTDDAIPRITFRDSMTLHFNGDEIRLIAFPGAHDSSDAIVWFTKAKIACVGGLSNGHHFPSVDSVGGDALKYAEMAQKVIGTLPEDVKIVPGHGEDGTMADYRAFQEMLARTTDLVRREVAKGKDLETLRKEDVLKDWQSFEGSYVDRNGWLKYLVEAINRKEPPGAGKLRPFEPLYRAYKEKGSEGAVAAYRDLKSRHGDEYLFDDLGLITIADKLAGRGKQADAIPVADLLLAEYPESGLAWYGHQILGMAHADLGHRDLAVKNLRKSLELHPDNPEVAGRLKELEK
jgi:cyclase